MPEKNLSKSLFGGFGDPTYISTDPDTSKTDPYIKQEPIPSRYLGSNFKVGRTPKGRTPDCFLGKEFPTLASATQSKQGPDPYVDPGKAEIRSAKDAKKKNISDKDFKYASVPKKPSGSGSPIGTFGGVLPHEPEYKVAARNEAADPEKRPKPQPPNIKTAAPKKGTYGFPGITIGEPLKPPKVNDEYDAMRRIDREAWEASKKKRIGAGVFRTAIPPKKTFDEKAASGVSAAFDYVEVKPGKEKKSAAPKEGEKKEDPKPWKLAGPGGATINGFPNKREDDKPDPYDTLRLKRKEEKEKGPKPLAGTWKPVSGPKSSVIRSLLKRYY